MSENLFEDTIITSIIDHFDEDLSLTLACQVALLVSIAQADGKFQKGEQELLKQIFTSHYKITVGVLENLFQDLRILMDESAVQKKLPLYSGHLKNTLSMQEKIIFISLLKDLIAADETIDDTEDIMFKNILLELGMNFDELNLE